MNRSGEREVALEVFERALHGEPTTNVNLTHVRMVGRAHRRRRRAANLFALAATGVIAVGVSTYGFGVPLRPPFTGDDHAAPVTVADPGQQDPERLKAVESALGDSLHASLKSALPSGASIRTTESNMEVVVDPSTGEPRGHVWHSTVEIDLVDSTWWLTAMAQRLPTTGAGEVCEPALWNLAGAEAQCEAAPLSDGGEVLRGVATFHGSEPADMIEGTSYVTDVQRPNETRVRLVLTPRTDTGVMPPLSLDQLQRVATEEALQPPPI